MKWRSDAQFESDIRNLPAISDNTKTLYITKLRSVTAAVQYATGSKVRPTIEESIARPVQSYAALTSYRIRRPAKTKTPHPPPPRSRTHRMAPLKPHTIHVTISAVLAMFKHMPRMERAMPPDTKAVWQNIADRTRDEAVGKYEDLEPTVEQREAYIPFERITKMRETLLKKQKLQKPTDKKGPQHTRYALLVLSLFSLFPPRRSYDWAIAAVLDRSKRADAQALKRDDIDRVYPNRIALGSASSSSASSSSTNTNTSSSANTSASTNSSASQKLPAAEVTFTLYKTASTYGKQTFALPPDLVAIIAHDIKAVPRRYLFQQTTTDRAMTNKEFSTLVGKVLRHLFPDIKGSPGISMLRHSYIVAADVGHLTPRVAKELASQMGHSRMQQLTYSYLIDDDEKVTTTTPPKPGTCRLICS
jgi:hypothetical protein